MGINGPRLACLKGGEGRPANAWNTHASWPLPRNATMNTSMGCAHTLALSSTRNADACSGTKSSSSTYMGLGGEVGGGHGMGGGDKVIMGRAVTDCARLPTPNAHASPPSHHFKL